MVGHILELGGGGHGLKGGKGIGVGVERLANVAQNVLQIVGGFVVAKVKHILDELGGLPPVAQVVEQGGFARAAHALHQQHIVPQQPLLKLENL